MHALFAEGADKMHITWAVEALPTLLHLSVFLFFGGLVVFLINLDHRVFSSVVWWIGLFTILYGSITLMPIVRPDSPYCAPLSRFAWFLYASIRLLYTKALASELIRNGNEDSRKRLRVLKERYRSWMSEGVEKAAEEMILERSSKIDIRIFDWTISALGDDKSLDKFFESIPGFFNSKPMKNMERDFPETLLKTFWVALNEFMGRTSSSNSVTEPDKSRRVTICRDIMNVIPCPNPISYDNLRPHLDQSPLPIWSLQAMTRWFTHKSPSVSGTARTRATELLPSVQKRDENWIAIASDTYGLSVLDLQNMVSLEGNNPLLSILINISRRTIQSNFREWPGEVLTGLTRFDILDTVPWLQHDFCALWNDIVQESRNQGSFSTPCDILHGLRHLYLSLHQGTDAAPTAFSASTDDRNHVLLLSSSYPFCNIDSHLPLSALIAPPLNVSFPTQSGDSPYPPLHQSTLGGGAALSLSGEANIIAGPPWPSAHPSPLPMDISPPSDVAAAMQNILSTATFSYSPEGNRQQDIATSNNVGMSSTMPTPVQVPASAPPPNTSSTSWEAYPASASNFMSRTPYVVDFPVPTSRPPSRASLKSANLITRLSGTAPSHPADNNTTRRLRALGIVNSGNKCFANAVLQLLVHCPPFWNLFKDRGRLIGQQGLEGHWQETCGGATPLLHATIKFLDEFIHKEMPPVMQQSQQKAGKRKSIADEEMKEHDTVDSLELTYIYDVMKEKRQLDSLLVCTLSL